MRLAPKLLLLLLPRSDHRHRSTAPPFDALHLRMTVISDDHDLPPFSPVLCGRFGEFFSQTDRSHPSMFEPLCFDQPVNPFRHAMGTDHRRFLLSVFGSSSSAFNDPYALFRQLPDHLFVVDDRSIRINRLFSFCDLTLYLIDSTLHAKTEPCRLCLTSITVPLPHACSAPQRDSYLHVASHHSVQCTIRHDFMMQSSATRLHPLPGEAVQIIPVAYRDNLCLLISSSISSNVSGLFCPLSRYCLL